MARAPQNPFNTPKGKKSQRSKPHTATAKADKPSKLGVSVLEDRLVPAGTVTGSVYQDFNANGVFDSTPATRPNEGAGQYGLAVDAAWNGPAVTVQAYDSANVLRGTTTTVNGLYSLNVTGSGPYRIEFTSLPAGVFFGPSGNLTGTSVQFVNDPNGGTAAGVNLGLVRAEDISSDNPLLVTSTYVFGPFNGVNGGVPAVQSFPYSSGSETSGDTQGAGFDAPLTHQINIPQSQVGSTWGLAYDRNTNQLYMAAFQKRHAGVGPGGYGAIYNTTAPNPLDVNASTTTASVFIDLEALAPGSTGTNYRTAAQFFQAPVGANVPAGGFDPGLVPYLYDGLYKDANGHDVGWDSVGKLGLGGLDVDDTGRFLFTVALGDRKLYFVDTVAKTIRSYDLPAPASLTGTQNDRLGDMRPFAVTYYRGQVYVGAVNTAESTTNNGTTVGDVNALKGYVFRFDPGANPLGGGGKFVDSTGTLTTTAPVFEFNLNYDRGNVHPGSYVPPGNTPPLPAQPVPAEWLPWSPVYKTVANPIVTDGSVAYPQPWLTGIDFDANGNMVLGLRDRAGDQLGSITPADTNAPNNYFQGITAGDTLRAFGSPAAGWALESNGKNPNGTETSANGQNTGQGPGGGEFYSGDYLQPGVYSPPGVTAAESFNDHDEVSVGGVLQLAGFPDVATTVFDPAQVKQRYNGGGIRLFSNTNGNATKGYELYHIPSLGSLPPAQFAKANGIGDLVAVSAAPVEIGNRVWLDTNRNGIQDPNEAGIPGVVVELLNAAGQPIGTATTDANGNYFFSTLAAPANNPQPGKTYGLNLTPNTQYQIRILIAQAPLAGLTVTTADASGDSIDSDGVLAGGYSQTSSTTGPVGANNHTYDFGFVNIPLALGDYVWLDTNVNSKWDAGEPAIPGVQVDLLNAAGAVIATTTTNSSGGYIFNDLAAGTYQVSIPINQAPLANLISSPGAANGNNNDHGTPAGASVLGPVVTLALGTAPTDEIAGAPGALGLVSSALDANSDRTQDFGFYLPPLAIGDYVWNDTNADGVWQAGEPAIAGVQVQLRNSAGTVLATTTTNSLGGYIFNDLAVGSYQIAIPINQAPLAGLTSSPGAASGNNNDHGTPDGAYVLGPVVALSFGTAPTGELAAATGTLGLTSTATDANSDRTQDFGFFSPPPPDLCLGDYVWRDLNADGVWQPGEPGIAGVLVELLNEFGTTIATTITNESGGYIFCDLPAGKYQICIPINQTPLTGLTSSPGATNGNNRDHGTPTGDCVMGPVVDLQPGKAPTDDASPPPSGLTDDAVNENSDRTQDFGFFSPPPPPPPASLSGYVFIDYPNINGIRQYDTGERGIGGTRVVLDGFDASGTRVPTRDTYTNRDGFYQFLNLAPGSYTVREEQPIGKWYDGIDAVGTVGGSARGNLGNDILSSITLNAGDAGVEYNFSELPVTGLWGYVFVDENFNGIRDAGETPIPGVTVTLTGTAFAGTVLQRGLIDADIPGGSTRVTDANGRYDFVNLPVGIYSLTETQPADYDDFREQDGDPFSTSRPGVANDVFTDLELGAQLRGPFNFGEGLSSSDPNRRRSPADSGSPTTAPANETSKRTFLGSSVDAAAGASGTETVEGTGGRARRPSLSLNQDIPEQVTPGGYSAVTGVPLYPQFNKIASDTREYTNLIVGTGAGIAPIIRVFDFATQTERSRFLAFESTFTGSVRTASGDINGDGIPDIVAVVGADGGPRVRVFDGQTGEVLQDFFAYEESFTGGLAVAVGDVNGDGFDDIITGTQVGGGPRVRIFSGTDGAVLKDFFAFDEGQRGGVRIAVADMNGDGKDDIVCTTAAGVPTRVRVYDGSTLGMLLDFAPYEEQFTGGAYIAVGDYNGDGVQDIITGADVGGGPSVKVFSGIDGTNIGSFYAYEEGFTGGVRVAVADFDRDGRAEIVTGAGVGGTGRVSIFSGPGFDRVDDFFAFDIDFAGGVFVATATGRRQPQVNKTGAAPAAAGFLATPGTLAALPAEFEGTTATEELTK